jgi:sigma-54 specific flagellar transcriptional regulator A
VTHAEKIIVVDDNQQRCMALKTVLEFIGQACDIIPSSQINAELANKPAERFSTLVIGSLPDGNYEPMIKSVPFLSVLVVGDTLKQLVEIPNVIALLSYPFHYGELTIQISDCQEYQRSIPGNRGKSGRRSHFQGFVGHSEAMNEVRFLIEQVAGSNANVLVLGESGTGKEVVASNIHLLSERQNGPFVPVNCGAIPGELLESELFGHEKGAFTGAISARKGRFELAQGGTLFLDEIGDMPLLMQVKLLRVLQERSFERVGGTKAIKCDVRVIAATHRNLEDMIETGAFREDLFYRLNVFPIETPALRERPEDLPLLITELMKRVEADTKQSIKFSERAVDSLKASPWAGNVRELANLVERMVIMYPGQVVDITELPKKYQTFDVEAFVPDYPEELMERDAIYSMFGSDDEEEDETEVEADNGVSGNNIMWGFLPPEGIQLKDYMAEIEINLITQALEYHDYVVARAAEILGVRRTTLVEKMKKYNLARDE